MDENLSLQSAHLMDENLSLDENLSSHLMDENLSSLNGMSKCRF